MDFDISILRTFVIVAKCGSFTKAAAIIGLSQSAVTQQIIKLEKQLKTPLFNRNKRLISLNSSGEKLFSHADSLLQLNDDLKQLFVEPAQHTTSIRFGSPEDFATHYLPDILSQFIHTHPSVKLHVKCDLTLNLIEDFEKGLLDVIIIKQKPGHIYKGANPLWREPLVWVTNHPISLDAIRSETNVNLVLSPQPCVYRQAALNALDTHNVPWQIVYESPSLAGAVAAVKAGLGLTVLPKNIVPRQLYTIEATSKKLELKDTVLCVLTRPNPNSPIAAFEQYVSNILVG